MKEESERGHGMEVGLNEYDDDEVERLYWVCAIISAPAIFFLLIYIHTHSLLLALFLRDSVNDKRNVWALAEAVIAPRSHFYEKQMYD